ncbi:MAG: hypothetical protein ACLU9S_22420 [Oscillospiraceae bacterium]
MSEYINDAHEIGWDDEISNDGGQYIVLEEGDYNFTVSAFERARFLGSAKIPACNKAVLTLAVDTPGGTASVKDDLLLWSSLEWKISEFFRAIGQKKHGEKLRPQWGAVVGSKGRGRFKPREYDKKDGSKSKVNDVEKFYDFDPNFFSGQSASASTSAPAPSAPAASAPKWAGKF